MPVSCELRGEVERRLAAHRRQERVGPLALEHAEHAFEVERLEVRAVGEARVGHDRRRVRVDDDRAEAVLAQHLERLRARVVELARLPDHDRAAADQADRVRGRYAAARSSSTNSPMIGQRVVRARARPRDGTAPSARARAESRGPRRCRRRARRASPRASSDGSTAKPWFCVVTSTRPDARSSTGWFAPRWPNGSLYVFIPARARAAGGRGRCRGSARGRAGRAPSATSSTSGSGSPGPFASSTPSWRASSSASTSCG